MSGVRNYNENDKYRLAAGQTDQNIYLSTTDDADMVSFGLQATYVNSSEILIGSDFVTISKHSDEKTIEISTSNRLENVTSMGQGGNGIITWDAATDPEYDSIQYEGGRHRLRPCPKLYFGIIDFFKWVSPLRHKYTSMLNFQPANLY